MFYNECPICGASLDPGEKCDCAAKKEACTAVTEQTSNVNNPKNLHFNYTISKGVVSSV